MIISASPAPRARIYIKGIEYEKTRIQEDRNTRIQVYDDGGDDELCRHYRARFGAKKWLCRLYRACFGAKNGFADYTEHVPGQKNGFVVTTEHAQRQKTPFVVNTIDI